MEIHRGEHHIARDDERLQRDDAACVDAHHGTSVAFEEPQRSDQLIGVVAPARDAGEVRIAQQIIHAIRVQIRPAHQLAQCRIAAFRIADDESEHVGRVELERFDAGAHRRQLEYRAGPLLVAHPEHRFARMTERAMADVVEQQRAAHEPPFVGIVRDAIVRARSDGQRAQGVREARMLGRGERKKCKTQLAQAAQALHRRQVEQARFARVEFDEVMDRIEDALHVDGDSGGWPNLTLNVPRLDQSVIREIHARIDIAAFIGQYVTLKKRGRDLVGLCPFHGEKTPSLHVHPEEGFFKCFGCGAGGDVIAFAMKLENLPFGDAARMLANKAGIALEAEDPRTARRRSEREAIYEANAIAAAYFERMLRSPDGAAARAYCEKRGFGEAVIERFHLGFAPDGWNGLTDELRSHGVDLALAAKAGLVKPSQRGGYYDFYRNRLMVPTYATTGEVIAFGGRELGAGEPKYLNTSTTPVYTKGEHLFALNVARRAAQADRTLIVVEGYLDCIALHQAGFEGAVAALGTAFTEKQASELRKYAENIYLCFDADAAGSNAATKAVEIASKVIEHAGSSVRIVQLPPGEDPDSFVRERGAAAFRALLETAKPSTEFKIDLEVERLANGFTSPAEISRRAINIVHQLAPREEWDRWLVYVASRLQVNPNDLRNSRFLANSANFSPHSDGASAALSRHAAVRGRGALQAVTFEREVLGIMTEDPVLVAEYATQIEPRRFRNALYRRVYERLVESASGLRSTADVFAAIDEDEEARDLLADLGSRDRSSLVRYGDSDERRAHLDRIVERLKREDEEQRYAEVSRAIDELFAAGQPVPEALRSEFNELTAKLKYSPLKK